MSVQETIQKRYSCRNFDNKPVPKELINKVLENIRLAPSGMNQQGWHFRVVTNQKINDDIGAVVEPLILKTRPQNIERKLPGLRNIVFYNAPVVIYATVPVEAHRMKYIDIGLAIENGALAAEELGLGAIIIGIVSNIAPETVYKTLGIDESKEEYVLSLGIGYVAEGFQRLIKPRKPIEEIVTYFE
ncbi:MAG: putative nitroreductase family protein [Streblomastix strix]|uniref:Putative nitroreductase family protein n=1 Tax=Streblomastix strix TaxID=222440 RepID=A0A5J4WG32_9EUKA|nr:MAG: putative nitroreductase family protein [Streblomastix strix]